MFPKWWQLYVKETERKHLRYVSSYQLCELFVQCTVCTLYTHLNYVRKKGRKKRLIIYDAFHETYNQKWQKFPRSQNIQFWPLISWFYVYYSWKWRASIIQANFVLQFNIYQEKFKVYTTLYHLHFGELIPKWYLKLQMRFGLYTLTYDNDTLTSLFDLRAKSELYE